MRLRLDYFSKLLLVTAIVGTLLLLAPYFGLTPWEKVRHLKSSPPDKVRSISGQARKSTALPGRFSEAVEKQRAVQKESPLPSEDGLAEVEKLLK